MQKLAKQCLMSRWLIFPSLWIGSFFESNAKFVVIWRFGCWVGWSYIFRLKIRQNEAEGDDFKFIVRCCHKILLEVLLFGDRRMLAKLERIGRQFYRITEDSFEQRPFLRFCLQIDPRFLIIAIRVRGLSANILNNNREWENWPVSFNLLLGRIERNIKTNAKIANANSGKSSAQVF